MNRTDVTITNSGINLEGIWQTPDGKEKFPAVIICHPHPLYGGDFHNNVVSTVSRALLGLSVATLRFNFRGVGKSGGVFSNGISEQEDVRAAIDFVLDRNYVDASRLGLAGYSFGGGVSIPVAFSDKRVKALTLISPQIMTNGWELLRELTIPKLLITGSEDVSFPAEKFEAEFRSVREPKQLSIIQGADHLWHGYEAELGEKVGLFFEEYLLGK